MAQLNKFWEPFTHRRKLNHESEHQTSRLRQAQEALRQSEERYRQLLELSLDAIFVHHDGIITSVNSAGVELLGAKKAEDLVGKHVLDFVHPDSREAAGGQIQRVCDTGRPAPALEQKLLRLDGTVFDAEVAVDAIIDRGRKGYLVVARDVAARKVAEAAQRESQARKSAMLESALDAIVTIDQEGTIFEWNPAAEKMFGYRRAAVLGKELAVNARAAMPKGGFLTINTERVTVDSEHALRNPEARIGELVCLTVQDTGCGIPAEILPRIFEPFFTTKNVGKGTGLGLATVFGIVSQHHGWIEVESRKGEGTAVRVFLPACERSAASADKEQGRITLRRGSGTILLVEDEIALRGLTRILLEEYGYRALEAGSGVEALLVWEGQQGRIDLLFTDMILPDGITGRDLAKQLKARKPDLKVIYTSGYALDLEGTGFILREGLNFLQKPSKAEKIIQAVQDLLGE